MVAGWVQMAVILIVEDDPFTCELAGMLIEGWGYDILSASDVDEALALLRSSQQIDALFTDIYLRTAVCGGCDLADQAIKLRPELVVIYTTGNLVTCELQALFVKGAPCLRKPYTPHQLRNTLGDMLAA
jgi:CheY-like chemotaxis protein